VNDDYYQNQIPQSSYRQKRRIKDKDNRIDHALVPIQTPDTGLLKHRIEMEYELIHNVMIPQHPIDPVIKTTHLTEIYTELGL